MLTILIPTFPGHRKFLSELLNELERQDPDKAVKIITLETDKSVTIGEKRNILLSMVKTKYCQFFDADDMPCDDYFKTILPLLDRNPDCLSLRGIMTTAGENPETFEHSLKYSEWKTTNNPIKYERYPNHLNIIRSDIAKQFKFPEKSHGEDHVWSRRVYESGLLKNEIYIDKVIYYYRYVPKKNYSI